MVNKQAFIAPLITRYAAHHFPINDKVGMLSEGTMSSSVGQSSRTSVKIAPGAIVCNESELRGTVSFRVYSYIFHFCFTKPVLQFHVILVRIWGL
jgi:hypothetical protein